MNGNTPEVQPPSRRQAGYLYLVTNLVNGKGYVGQTSGAVAHRWSQHLVRSKRGRSALHGAIRKYGAESFRIEVLAQIYGSREDLLKAEVVEIQLRKTLAPQGYNLMPGGEGVDFSDPRIKANHRDAISVISASPAWQSAQYEGARRRVSDPVWRAKNVEVLANARASEGWHRKKDDRWQRFYSDPDFRARFVQALQERSASDSWKKNHGSAMRRLHTDPSYIAKRDEALQRAAETRTRKALERDLLYSPEDAARRARRRELKRLRATRKRLEAQECA